MRDDASFAHFFSSNSGKVLIASVDASFRENVLRDLPSSGWTADYVCAGAQALLRWETQDHKALILDEWLPDLDVAELASLARESRPHFPVFVGGVATSPGSPHREPVKTPRQAVPEPQRLSESEFRGSGGAGHPTEPIPDMIGISPAMQEVYRAMRVVARHSTTVLVLGETGTGKELVARGIHRLSERNQQPFVTVNCAAIPEALLEAELFGYTRGAFTGAFEARRGRLAAANRGTVFLDEVGELPLSMQSKLLRFLQNGEIQQLGSTQPLGSDVRVVGATNANLMDRVRQKTFREDLYYRLAVFPIELPALKFRERDVMSLSTHFLAGLCRDICTASKQISPAAQAMLEQYSWPGNVRELQHVIERAFILAGESGEIGCEHIHLEERAMN